MRSRQWSDPVAWSASWSRLWLSGGLSAADRDRPNILWISVEDISRDLGCYGQDLVRTPTLDNLAATGVRYTRAFTIAGVCAVNRSGMITGVYPPTIGTQHMRCTALLPESIPHFPRT